VSVTTDRAIVFMSEPQDVEVYRGGDWVLGSMVGWRHEDDSSCWAMVRLTEGRTEKTAWADLEHVRLPEERDSSPAEPRTVLLTLAGRPVTTPSSTPGSVPPRRRRTDAWTEPPSQPVVDRDDEFPWRAGRHRAPSAIGRNEAADQPDAALETPRGSHLPALSRWEPIADLTEETPPSWWSSAAAPALGPVSAELTRPLTLPSPPRRRPSDVEDGAFPSRRVPGR